MTAAKRQYERVLQSVPGIRIHNVGKWIKPRRDLTVSYHAIIVRDVSPVECTTFVEISDTRGDA